MTQDEDLEDLIYKRRAAANKKWPGFAPVAVNQFFSQINFVRHVVI